MNWSVPTIAGIQRLALLLTLVVSAALFVFVSEAAAIGAVVGGVLMIVNLYLLVLVGKTMVAIAGGGGAVGAIIAPMKLLLFVVVAYLIISRLHVDLRGFMLGVLTQFAAIFIETGRVSWRGASAPEEHKV
ncbi:MAG TPA: hypothetical protein VKS22_04515 [Candidatus Binataceae bacterium]|nr:hypothetical protein [Candidatus Binataceae bacterium]